MSSANQKKLDASINRLTNFKPIAVRELEDGSLEILGGAHRTQAYIRRGDNEVHVWNVGKISDTEAKEISLADNERYGEDDSEAMTKLLNSLDTVNELVTFLPIEDDQFDSFWDKAAFDLDSLDLDEEDDDDSVIEKPTSSAPTQRVVRFKLAIEDAERLSDHIEKIIKKNAFTSSDALTNAGDALIHTLKDLW